MSDLNSFFVDPTAPAAPRIASCAHLSTAPRSHWWSGMNRHIKRASNDAKALALGCKNTGGQTKQEHFWVESFATTGIPTLGPDTHRELGTHDTPQDTLDHARVHSSMVRRLGPA